MTETVGKYKLSLEPINLDHLTSLVNSLSDASDDEKVKILSQIIKMVHREVWRLTGVKIRESLGE